jgi:hypothetical protein
MAGMDAPVSQVSLPILALSMRVVLIWITIVATRCVLGFSSELLPWGIIIWMIVCSLQILRASHVYSFAFSYHISRLLSHEKIHLKKGHLFPIPTCQILYPEKLGFLMSAAIDSVLNRILFEVRRPLHQSVITTCLRSCMHQIKPETKINNAPSIFNGQ